MTSPILVTGGTGKLGRFVVARLLDAGRDVRVLSRSRTGQQDGAQFVTGDLATGEGIQAAVDGTATIVHCATSPKGDAKATRNLLEAASSQPKAPHLVYITIVGADSMSFGYPKEKVKAERIIASSGLPWTMLRATQFYELIFTGVRRLAMLPLIPVPAGFVVQPVDPADVAARLAELALGEPAGQVPDMGGPQILSFADLVRAYLRAAGRRRWVAPVRMPGTRAIREGALLPASQPGTAPATGKRTWEEFLAEKLR